MRYFLILSLILLGGCRSCSEINQDPNVIAQEGKCLAALESTAISCIPQCLASISTPEATAIACAIECGIPLVTKALPECAAIIAVIIADDKLPVTAKLTGAVRDRVILVKTMKRLNQSEN